MTIVLIPAYNEEKTILDVVRRAQHYADEIVVIDDGSDDQSGAIARNVGVTVLTHILNRGLGSALRTGFAYALIKNAACVITLDADGQHDPHDIVRLLQKINEGFDVVIGSRMSARTEMPLSRVIANKIGTFFSPNTISCTDTQSGLRCFRGEALKKMNLCGERMEISSEIIDEISHQSLRYAEIPIRAMYTHYSLSKGQGFMTGLITLGRLLYNRLSK